MGDRELLVVSGKVPPRRGLYVRLAHALYGDGSSDAALAHAGFLAVLMCNIVGVYWLMRSLKDSVFTTVVGIEYQPTAKILSLVVVTVLLLVYNKAFDLLSAATTQRGSVAPVLFAAVFSGFAATFGLLAICLSSTTYGLYGPGGEPLPASPRRVVGWALYFAIEAYGSLSVSLFWQFVNSQMGVKAAKVQYGIIVAGGQVGAIGGCTLVLTLKRLGVPRLCGLGAVLCVLPLLSLRCLVRAVPPFASMRDNHGAPPGGGGVGRGRVKPGLFEGARLVATHRYVLAICMCTSGYKVVATIMDYQLQVLVRAHSRTPDEYAAFMGLFGLATNSVSLGFSLLGTSFVLRVFGMRSTLMGYPVMLGAVALANYAHPDVWAMFYLQVGIKGLSYALQSPSREMLYIVTTDAIKFKAKSWIDVFGGHAAKALGSGVNHSCKHSFDLLMAAGSLVSCGICLALVLLSSWLGRTFEASTAADQLIGDENSEGCDEEDRALVVASSAKGEVGPSMVTSSSGLQLEELARGRAAEGRKAKAGNEVHELHRV